MEKLPFIYGKVCKYCGTKINSGNVCLECEQNRYHFNKGISVLEYTEFSKKLIFNLKNHKKTYLAFYFAKMLSDRLNIQDFSNIDYITYVPMTEEKKKIRGYNQSELIAKYLSSILNTPCIKIIKKTKKTKSLKNLGKKKRIKELKNAFYPNSEKNIESKKVLLVDDIFTTGSTLNECSKVIYENYLCNVFVATIYNKGR